MALDELLMEYKKLTIEMIEKVKEDIDISDIVIKRGKVLEKFKEGKFDRSEIRDCYNSLNIIELENMLKDLLEKSKLDVRKQINKLKQAKIASDRYMNFKSGAHIFSTQR